MLVAFHLGEVVGFVSRHYRRIFVGTGAIGVLMVLWYMISVWSGSTVERASDIYEPQAALWCLAAIGGIFSLSWWWHQRTVQSRRESTRTTLPLTAYLAGLTGGVFFAHTIFIDVIRSELTTSGLRAHLPWEATVAILFVGTVLSTGALIALVLHTPLRWVLGGPVRSEERASYIRRDAVTVRPAGLPISGEDRSDPGRPAR